MKAAVFQGKEKILVKEVKIPSLSPGETLIKVAYAGICGSDIHILAGRHGRVRPPRITGHEFSGEVVEIRSQEKGQIKEGDRVVVWPLLPCGECYACRWGIPHVCQDLNLIGIDVDGGFAEYVKAPLDNLYQIPDDLPLDEAALTEPLSVAFHAVRRSSLKVGDAVVILGAGPIGLLVAQIAKLSGASLIAVTEVNQFRLDLAKSLGFSTIDVKKTDPLKQVRELTGGKGADITFEAAAALATVGQMVALTRIRGEILQVGNPREPIPVDLLNISFKELTLKGTRVYTGFDFQSSIKLAAEGKVNLKSLITHRLELDRISEGFEIIKKGKEAVKVLIRPAG